MSPQFVEPRGGERRRGYQPDTLFDDRSHRHFKGWRFGCIRVRCVGEWSIFSGPQVPRVGDRGQLWEHKPGSVQRHGRMGGMDQSRTGDNKTDIVVIADFWKRTGGIFSPDRDLSGNAFQIPFGGSDFRSFNRPGRVGTWDPQTIDTEDVFRSWRYTATRCEHALAALGTERGDFSILQTRPVLNFRDSPASGLSIPMHIQAPRCRRPKCRQFFPQFGTHYKGGGDYFSYNFAAATPALPPADRQAFYGSFMRDLCDKYLTVFADLNMFAHFTIGR